MVSRRGRTSRRSALVARPDRHGRHGRQGRSSVVRPPIGPVDTRFERFDIAVGAASEFLRSAWPDLQDVRFEIAGMPAEAGPDGIPRWHVDRAAQRIVIYRMPVERLSRPHQEDDLHRRMIVEGIVFRAAAEYLDRDPWDLGPDRFRF
ncbi:metallopeptidase family protein [Microbacterium sp. LRZ72]|uniref:metallopeptidase family protein n=1 Tax=Microbacterium sp. LRZ72 TaxID=2942481 RepID=UPI0029A7940A|nr:metallopeptidase family protein [Microbacterium sp. LRZ72]MDX2377040.1 metallopeptidase family protein [Microbacterium sp. LRZ72]